MSKVPETSANPQLLDSCVEIITAGLCLVAGQQRAQALVTLHNAESIHRALIADTRNLNYETLKRT